MHLALWALKGNQNADLMRSASKILHSRTGFTNTVHQRKTVALKGYYWDVMKRFSVSSGTERWGHGTKLWEKNI